MRYASSHAGIFAWLVACTAEPGGAAPSFAEGTVGEASTTNVDPSSTTTLADDTSGDRETDTSSGDSTSTTSLDVGDDTGDPVAPCADGNDRIWVLGVEEATTALYRFDPEVPDFERVAALPCVDAERVEPGAIGFAVDRTGRALLAGLAPGELWSLSLTAPAPCDDLERGEWPGPGEHAQLAFWSESVLTAEAERLLAHSEWTVPAGMFSEVFFDADGPVVSPLSSSVESDIRLTGSADGRMFGLLHHGSALSLSAIDPIAGVPRVGSMIENLPLDTTAAFYDGGVLLFVVGQEQKLALDPGVHRCEADDEDGNGTYDIESLFAGLPPIAIGAVAASTCVPTPFGG